MRLISLSLLIILNKTTTTINSSKEVNSKDDDDIDDNSKIYNGIDDSNDIIESNAISSNFNDIQNIG